MPESQLTVLLSNDRDVIKGQKLGMTLDDTYLIVPHVLIDKLIKKTKENGNKMFLFFNEQECKETSEEEAIASDNEKSIIIIDKGEIVSHKFFVTA